MDKFLCINIFKRALSPQAGEGNVEYLALAVKDSVVILCDVRSGLLLSEYPEAQLT